MKYLEILTMANKYNDALESLERSIMVSRLTEGKQPKEIETTIEALKIASNLHTKLKSMRHDAGEYGHLTRYQEGQNDLIDAILKGELL